MVAALAMAAALAATVAMAAAPALAARAGAPAALAGYSLSSLASPVRAQLDSPGLVPVGDPQVGTIAEADLPLARTDVTAGPLIDALASPAYPGDTAAHLGTIIGTFGGPPLPDDPVVAESEYPPSPPDHGALESFGAGPTGAGGLSVGAGTARSTATPGGASATSTLASVSAAVPGVGSDVLDVGPSRGTDQVSIASDAIATTSVASLGRVTIASVIGIDGIRAIASAHSDGRGATSAASLDVGAVTVDGHAAYLDATGVHLDRSGVPATELDRLQGQLHAALARDGLTVRVLSPELTRAGGSASATAGGIAITIDRQVPSASVPGLSGLSVPGAPPVPLVTPAVPLRIVILLGRAEAAADATTAPGLSAGPTSAGAPGRGTAGEGRGGPASGGGPAGGAALASDGPAGPVSPSSTGAGAGSPGPVESTLPATGPGVTPGSVGPGQGTQLGRGPQPLAAQPVSHRPVSLPVPVSWVVLGMLASLGLAGLLLSYARWQLGAERAGP